MCTPIQLIGSFSYFRIMKIFVLIPTHVEWKLGFGYWFLHYYIR